MGSAKVTNAKPLLTMEEKKSIKNLLKKPFQALFQKEKKKIKSGQEKPATQKPPATVAPVANLLESLQKLEIEDHDDDLKHFSFKVVPEDRRSDRVDSQSSEDSGFSEKTDETDCKDELVDGMKNLQVKEKKKKLQTVVVSRGPVKNKSGDSRAAAHPYCADAGHNIYKQVNRNTFSGGHVITNSLTDNFPIVDKALTELKQNNAQNFSASVQDQDDYWHLIQEFIIEDCDEKINRALSTDNILSDFAEVQSVTENYQVNNFAPVMVVPNPIEQFNDSQTFNDYNLEMPVAMEAPNTNKSFVYPTPPRSDHMPSPMSDTHSTFYQSNSEYTPPSPERSSPIDNIDYEKYQEISQFERSPSYTEHVDEGIDKPLTRERKLSTSSMTMKQYKDMQKEITGSFSKKDCCQLNRKSCKEIFEEHMTKLSLEDRRALCLKVAKLDLKQAYGVLHHILLKLSESDNNTEDLQHALFSLICERILAEKPAVFAQDLGLSLIKLAVLRCHRRPLFTRYLVQCARAAYSRCDHNSSDKQIFAEVDALGDNVIGACARAGDAYGPVLAELVRGTPEQVPLFDVHHANAEGHSALQVACLKHSADSPRLYIVHVLLHHAGADLWKGDVKGGDTAVHLAVNSASCDLRLVMLLFRHVDRKMWKQLAHAHNRSSVTPLEYARSATKSTTRQNYPPEILEFLKKCR